MKKETVAVTLVGLTVFGGLALVAKHYVTKFMKQAATECSAGVGEYGCEVLLDKDIFVVKEREWVTKARLADASVAAAKIVGQETVNRAKAGGYKFIDVAQK